MVFLLCQFLLCGGQYARTPVFQNSNVTSGIAKNKTNQQSSQKSKLQRTKLQQHKHALAIIQEKEPQQSGGDPNRMPGSLVKNLPGIQLGICRPRRTPGADDEDNDRFLNGTSWRSTYWRLEKPVARADFARYALMYQFGAGRPFGDIEYRHGNS